MSAAECPAGKSHRTPGRTDGPTKCTWYPNTTEACPHVHEERYTGNNDRISDSVLDNIGNTPLVRVNKIAKEEGVECEILAKCEFFNAGGSVKDRIGRRMVLDAEREGRIKPGDTLIEPTSGNTGIGLALAAAIRGYRMIITLPEKMSREKVDVLKALGAEIIRTPSEASYDSPESHINVAKRLNEQIPNSHILDQYANPSNPLAHYNGTAEELIAQCDGRLDAVVVGAGTGGTVTGIARKLKEKIPGIRIIGVDPKGSILAEPDSLNDEGRLQGYQVEGTGYDFIPTVLDRDLVDEWVKTSDAEAFTMSRRLIREEGLLCGGSSGSAMAAAVRYAKDLGAGKRVAVVLPDSVRNYMTKFLSDSWMVEHDFMEATEPEGLDTWWAKRTVADLPLQTAVTVTPTVSCKAAAELLHSEGFDQLPVVDENGSVRGMVSAGNLTAKLVSGRLHRDDPVTKAMFHQFKQIPRDTSLGLLSSIFDRDHFALVTSTQRCVGSESVVNKTIVYGVVTRIDLLKFIMSSEKEGSAAGSA